MSRIRQLVLVVATVLGLVGVPAVTAGAQARPAAHGVSAAQSSPRAASSVSPVAAAVTAPGGFTALPPTRILDTRSNVGATGPVAAGATAQLQVLGVGGVPATGVSAVVMNVTVTRPTAGGFLTVFPGGTTLPSASNLNFATGQTVPNLVVVKVGGNGKVQLRNGSTGTVHLIGDVAGYYVGGAPSAAGAFVSLSPTRILDTRSNLGATGPVAASATAQLQVLGRGGVPATGVSAVVLNVTVVAPSAGGFVTVFPGGASVPSASNLNFAKGRTVPNLVVVKVGGNGKVQLKNGSAGTLQLIADVAGYYVGGTPSVEGAFASLSPTRILDTRSGLGATGPVAAGATAQLQVLGRGGVPATGVSAVVLNVTVVAPSAGGFVTVFPGGTSVPSASNLNFFTGQTVPNLVVVQVGTDGKVQLRNGAAGSLHLLADVAGWYRATTATTGLTGTVRDAGGTHHGLAGVVVHAFTATGERTATTTATGGYSIAGILPGSRVMVCFDGLDGTGGSSDTFGYVYECAFAEQVIGASALTVVDHALAAGGSVTGHVTDAGGTHQPLAGVVVRISMPEFAGTASSAGGTASLGKASPRMTPSHGTVRSPLRSRTDPSATHRRAGPSGAVAPASGPARSSSTSAAAGDTEGGREATTAADGSYTIRGLAPVGSYDVCFEGETATGGSGDVAGYVEQCRQKWLNVSAGQQTTGVDAALNAGGAIAGTVTDAGGTHHALAGVLVMVDSPAHVFADDTSATAGTWSVRGIPAGTSYNACFDGQTATGGSKDAVGYLDKCITPVAVQVGATKTVDTTLGAGGAISGRVTDAGGAHAGLAGVEVGVFSDTTQDFATPVTAADGSYVARGLRAGTDYVVCFHTWGPVGGGSVDALGYISECFDNKPETTPSPTLVTATVGSTRTGVNAALAPAGGISGTVTDAGGTHHGLAGVFVSAQRMSTGEGGLTVSAANGGYLVGGLVPGSDYTVCFQGSSATGGSTDNLGYVDECFDNQPFLDGGTPVGVTSGAVHAGVNAALSAGGVITGTVTDAGGTHQPLAGVFVSFDSESKSLGGGTISAADGTYRITGLATGTDYHVCFDGTSATGGSSDVFGYAMECFDNRTPTQAPTNISVTAGNVRAGISAALSAAGAISGRVDGLAQRVGGHRWRTRPGVIRDDGQRAGRVHRT